MCNQNLLAVLGGGGHTETDCARLCGARCGMGEMNVGVHAVGVAVRMSRGK